MMTTMTAVTKITMEKTITIKLTKTKAKGRDKTSKDLQTILQGSRVKTLTFSIIFPNLPDMA